MERPVTQRRRVALLSTLLIFATAAAAADATRSALTGTVTSQGKPVSGVTIWVSSPALIAPRSSTSGANGDYTFPALPPGLYAVSFEREGMQSQNRRARLDLAQTTRLDAELKPSAVAETITITAVNQTVMETPQAVTSLDAELIEQLAIGRRIRDRVTIGPAVELSPNGQIVISGAPPSDNLELADGAFIARDPTIEEAIQATAVITGAISAEYGRFTGGLISTITRSGGNDFSGSLRDNLVRDQPGQWNSAYEATLGGPVVPERLWFFAAARKDDGTATGDRYEGKLTGSVASNHTIAASFLDAPEGGLRAGHYTGIAGDNLVVEALYGHGQAGDNRRSWTGKGSYFLSTKDEGSHEIVAGFDEWKTSASFINDAWHLSTHWSFNLGARYDSSLSPRLAAIYDIGGDGHQRATVTYGRYTSDIGPAPASMNEMTASYAMNIGGNGFLRGDFIHRTWSDDLTRSYDGVQIQGTYRLLGFVTAGGNYTLARSDELNAWLLLAPPMPFGALALSVLERNRSTNLSATYAVPAWRVSLFVKADLFNAFDVDHAMTLRTTRIATGLRF